jgi:hypothetical protein
MPSATFAEIVCPEFDFPAAQKELFLAISGKGGQGLKLGKLRLKLKNAGIGGILAILGCIEWRLNGNEKLA